MKNEIFPSFRKRFVNPFERGTLQEVEQMQLAMKQNNTSDTARYEEIEIACSVLAGLPLLRKSGE